MNVAIYGGTFDPIHNGHLAVAAAVTKVFHPEKILLVPNDLPPHRSANALTSYHHRYAMVALAASSHSKLVASDLESPAAMQALGRKYSYSIDTVMRVRREMKASGRVFFILGADAFWDIAKWRQPVELLRACEIIAVSRPGFSLEQAITALPSALRSVAEPDLRRRKVAGYEVVRIATGGAVVHLLNGVASKVSATQVRERVWHGGRLTQLLPPGVAEYIRKSGLYCGEPSGV